MAIRAVLIRSLSAFGLAVSASATIVGPPSNAQSVLVRYGENASRTCHLSNFDLNHALDIRWDAKAHHLVALRDLRPGVALDVYSPQGKLLHETHFGKDALGDSRLVRLHGHVAFTLGYYVPNDHEELIEVDDLGKPISRKLLAKSTSADELISKHATRQRRQVLSKLNLTITSLIPSEPLRSRDGAVGEPAGPNEQIKVYPALFENVSRGPIAFGPNLRTVAAGGIEATVARRQGDRWISKHFTSSLTIALRIKEDDLLSVYESSAESNSFFFAFKPDLDANGRSMVAKIVNTKKDFRLVWTRDGTYAPPMDDLDRA